jgi:hypothetical protein
MSRSATPSAPVLRPTVLDYLLLLAGAGLSLFLIELGPLPVEASSAIADPALKTAVGYLPHLLRLPEGITLLLPFFFLLQLPRGRRESLTAAEWLWLVSWFGTALLTALVACAHFNLLPEFIQANLLLIRFVWCVGFELAMAAVALLLLLIGFFRPAPPWTHQLALALALWPAAPVAGILALTKLFL